MPFALLASVDNLRGWWRVLAWLANRSSVMTHASVGTPSITNCKPQLAWKSIHQWLEAMQVIAAA
jgi:hypothetical protein